MQAVYCENYGPIEDAELKETEKPVPIDDMILVKVMASSVNFGNLAMITGRPLVARAWSGLQKSKFKIPGGDIAGRIESVGKNIRQFKPGDEVYGDLSGCGWGSYAEYVCVPEQVLSRKPPNLSFEEAAAVPMAAVTALQGLRDKGEIAPGQSVLIYGASGGVGTFAVQIAKALKAEVTAVCSTRNMELMRSIGADHVIDYNNEDFIGRGQQYDLIMAVNGYRPIRDYKHALKHGGRYVMAGGIGKQIFEVMILGPILSLTQKHKMVNLLHKSSQDDLNYLTSLIEEDKIHPVIDRCFQLNEFHDAIRYYSEGHAKGKIVIRIKSV